MSLIGLLHCSHQKYNCSSFCCNIRVYWVPNELTFLFSDFWINRLNFYVFFCVCNICIYIYTYTIWSVCYLCGEGTFSQKSLPIELYQRLQACRLVSHYWALICIGGIRTGLTLSSSFLPLSLTSSLIQLYFVISTGWA